METLNVEAADDDAAGSEEKRLHSLNHTGVTGSPKCH